MNPAAAGDHADTGGSPDEYERLLLDDVQAWMFDHTDEEIADAFGADIRTYSIVAPGREALLAWVAERRRESDYPSGPCSLQEQADELNVQGYLGVKERGERWIVFAGEVMVKGRGRHAALLRARGLRRSAQPVRAVHAQRGTTRASRARRGRSTAAASDDGPRRSSDDDPHPRPDLIRCPAAPGRSWLEAA